MTWISTYGNTYLGVGALVAFCACVVFILLAFLLTCILAARSPGGEISASGCIMMGFVASFLITGQIFWCIAGATISGVGFASAASMYACAAIPWLFVIPLTVAALTPKLWRGHPSGIYNSCCFTFSAAFRAIKVKPVLCWSFVVAALTMTAIIFVGMQGLCYCSNPSQVSSWASRRVTPPICVPGTVCHAYPLLGETPDIMHVVVQWVASPETTTIHNILRAEAILCQVSTPLDNCSTSSTAKTVQAEAVVPFTYLAEDLRYVARFTFSNLQGLTGYRALIRLIDGTTIVTTHQVHFKTVPDVNDTTSVIRFVGGGDYYMGEKGLQTLMTVIQETPDASAIFLGGDLSYANNMRTCYRRWDQFFVEITKCRTNVYGFQLPLIILPGNHESGGYTSEKNKLSDIISRNSNSSPSDYYFFHEYFPHMQSKKSLSSSYSSTQSSSDQKILSTFHSHELGAYLGFIMLDSNLYVAAEDQSYFLNYTLNKWTKAKKDSQNKNATFPIPMFHVPAFPGGDADTHSGSDKVARTGVKDIFTPLFEQYKVSTVFQYHEHVYFRSKPIDVNGNVQSSNSDGIIYLGDGAMGVASSSRPIVPASSSTDNYVQVSASKVQFAYSVTFFPSNRSLHVVALTPVDEDNFKKSQKLGKVFDSVDIAPRV